MQINCDAVTGQRDNPMLLEELLLAVDQTVVKQSLLTIEHLNICI